MADAGLTYGRAWVILAGKQSVDVYAARGSLYLPAQMNSARIKTMEVIVFSAESFAQLAVNGALVILATMVIVWHITSTVVSSAERAEDVED